MNKLVVDLPTVNKMVSILKLIFYMYEKYYEVKIPFICTTNAIMPLYFKMWYSSTTSLNKSNAETVIRKV